jgi:hypothetical protein
VFPPTRPNVHPAPENSSRSTTPTTLSRTLPDEETTTLRDATTVSALALAPALDLAQTHLQVAMETQKRRFPDPSLATSKEQVSASHGAHLASVERQRTRKMRTSLAASSSATSSRRCSGTLHLILKIHTVPVSDLYTGSKVWPKAITALLQASSGP